VLHILKVYSSFMCRTWLVSSTPYLSPQLLINHYSMEHSVTSHSFATYAVKMLQLFMSEHARWVVAAVY
jgi:hypothetical protein